MYIIALPKLFAQAPTPEPKSRFPSIYILSCWCPFSFSSDYGENLYFQFDSAHKIESLTSHSALTHPPELKFLCFITCSCPSITSWQGTTFILDFLKAALLVLQSISLWMLTQMHLHTKTQAYNWYKVHEQNNSMSHSMTWWRYWSSNEGHNITGFPIPLSSP